MQEETSRDIETEKKEKPHWVEDRQLHVLIPRQGSSCIGQSVPAGQ